MSDYAQIMNTMQALLPHPTKENYMRTYRLLCGSSFYNPFSKDVEELESLLNAGNFNGVVQKYKAANPNIILTPQAHLVYAFALKELKEINTSQIFIAAAMSVCEAIRTTGTGTQSSPFIVTHQDSCAGFVEFGLEKDPISIRGDAETALQIIKCKDGSEVWFDFFTGMNMKTEFLKGTKASAAAPAEGNVLRHSPDTNSAQMTSALDKTQINFITNHVEKHIGKIKTVFHEMLSGIVHVDLLIVAPTEYRSFYTVVTCGMSALPMGTPKGAGARFAELMLCLPQDWPMSQEAWTADETTYWPMRWMKDLACNVHEFKTWYGIGHTIPNGDPPEPFSPKTRLSGWLIGNPHFAPQEFMQLEVGQKSIAFYAMAPLYKEEMDFKLSKGYPALVQRMDEIGVDELIDVNRPNVCK
jgi:hypothetical protein